ncbi:MAG: hypothetical protein IJ355_01775 [Prevotella sp.]|nr:hypothetical protein [Prevotella sp.]
MRIISLIIITMFCIGKMVAQTGKEVVVKAGTIVLLQSVNQVKAADVEEGQMVDFKVVQDVMVDEICVIPSGTLVKGKVTEAKKSSLVGTKGRLSINISYLNLPSGTPIYFSNTDVRIKGKNKTPLAVVTGLIIWPCLFIPGTKAVMPAGYEVQATIAANATINVK